MIIFQLLGILWNFERVITTMSSVKTTKKCYVLVISSMKNVVLFVTPVGDMLMTNLRYYRSVHEVPRTKRSYGAIINGSFQRTVFTLFGKFTYICIHSIFHFTFNLWNWLITLNGLCKTFWGTTKKRENKFRLIFIFQYNFLKGTGGERLESIIANFRVLMDFKVR